MLLSCYPFYFTVRRPRLHIHKPREVISNLKLFKFGIEYLKSSLECIMQDKSFKSIQNSYNGMFNTHFQMCNYPVFFLTLDIYTYFFANDNARKDCF